MQADTVFRLHSTGTVDMNRLDVLERSSFINEEQRTAIRQAETQIERFNTM